MVLTGARDRVRAFLTVIFNRTLVVNNMKLIADNDGKMFLDMPTRALGDHCPMCGSVTEYRHFYCYKCGTKLASAESRCTRYRPDGSLKLYVSTTFPCDDTFREQIEDIVFHVFNAALQHRFERSIMRFDERGEPLGSMEAMQPRVLLTEEIGT
jgi:DNA-binding cell septation regulator SpoVG